MKSLRLKFYGIELSLAAVRAAGLWMCEGMPMKAISSGCKRFVLNVEAGSVMRGAVSVAQADMDDMVAKGVVVLDNGIPKWTDLGLRYFRRVIRSNPHYRYVSIPQYIVRERKHC